MTFWLNGEKTDASSPSLAAQITEQNHLQENGSALPKHVQSVEHLPEHHHEKQPKIIAVVPPLSPQHSFRSIGSKKGVTINSNPHLNHSLKDLSHLPLINGKKTAMFGKKKQVSMNNENLQPLLSTITNVL